MDFDTITSISTPMGEGQSVLSVYLDRKPLKLEISYIKGKKKLEDVDSHTINYGHIVDH